MAAITKSLFKENYEDKLLFVEETDGNVSADFLLSSIIVDQLRKNPNAGMCFIFFHNTFSHFSNICSQPNFKLKLNNMANSNKVVFIDAAEVLMKNNFGSNGSLTVNSDLSSFYLKIEQGLKNLVSNGASHIYLFIESVSDLFYLNCPLKSVINFIQNCLNIISNQKASTLVISARICDSNSEQKLLSAFLKHLSHYNFKVFGLKTGYSSEVSGNFIIEKKNTANNHFNISKNKFYFKLEDNSVIIYDGIASRLLK